MTKKRLPDDDDGRVIAPMNVDGMPWYLDAARKNRSDSAPDDLTRSETREIIRGAVKAGLLIGSVFLIAAALFILFCVYVWFR